MGRLLEKERRTAEFLAGRGNDVRVLPEDHTKPGKTNVDLLVRSNPADHGTWTELKTLDEARSATVRRETLCAGKQLKAYGDGQVVIDGRAAGLTEEVAERGIRRAIGQAQQHGGSIPESITIILRDGSVLSYQP